MKQVEQIWKMNCRKWLGLALLVSAWPAMNAAAVDIEIARRWATSAPTINGAIAPGEWNNAKATTLARGQMRTMNDLAYLYVLLDVTADTGNDPIAIVGNNSDYFTLAIDVDQNRAVTPHVDFIYSTCQNGDSFVKSFYLTASSFTGCQDVVPASRGKAGFGPTFNSATPHRFWEFRLSLAELGVDPTTWTTSGGLRPHVRLNVGLHSYTPSFTSAQPMGNLWPNFASDVFQVDLASGSSFPPGSTGPTFAGVGLVPANYIDTAGYANINIANYYSATNAPFGGKLNVFGHWNTLYAGGARKYRVLSSRNGGPFTPLRQTWTNFKFNGTTWSPIAIGPAANDSYPVPPPTETWYLPNLLVSWQSDTFANGTYRLKLELLDAVDSPLAAPPDNSLTLFVVNTPPTVTINNAYYAGSAICECGIVTQGDFPRGFTFDITVNDPNGALNSYALGGTFGNNHSIPTIASDLYTNGHINEDGARRWEGENNKVVPGGFLVLPWRASRSCAYTFTLSASSRVQNGYGLVFPYVAYNKSLTILLGTGNGTTDCPP
jgi:hypothetical protein